MSRASCAFAVAVFAAQLALAACGPSAPEPTDPRLLRADSDALSAVIGRDSVPRILTEADGMIDDRRPVRAAEIMRTSALPAVRRHLERVGAVALRTAEGRELRGRAVRAYRQRMAAIERYASALARGEVEDNELLIAVRSHREAEEEVLAVIEAARSL